MGGNSYQPYFWQGTSIQNLQKILEVKYQGDKATNIKWANELNTFKKLRANDPELFLKVASILGQQSNVN